LYYKYDTLIFTMYNTVLLTFQCCYKA